MAEAVRIEGGRLLADLHALRDFGRHDPGVVRRSFSRADRDSRDWLRGRFAEAGLEARIDGVGNVIGRSPNPGPALLIGSHSDTQPRGGWLDGAMGVIYALEVARALAEGERTRGLAVDIVSWVDEEGAFFNCLGCHSFMGSLPEGLLARVTDGDGITAAEAIRAAGYDAAAPARWEPERHIGYLEAHIEQGPYLEEQGNRVGVVTSIVGRRNVTVSFEGEQNHAGTTPMNRRKDAGMAAIRLGAAIDAAFREIAGPATVWTIGDLVIEPGKTTSIVPGRAVMRFQFRDPETARLDALDAAFQRLVAEARAAGPVAVAVKRDESDQVPTVMDAGFQEHIARAAEVHAPGKWVRMPSAAGHDAMVVAEQLPAAMLFVPSIGGISHDFAEDTAEADIVLGCQVLADAAASILAEARAG